MPSFKRLLFATDFSKASGTSFEIALQLCQILGAELSILHVFEHTASTPPETGGQLLGLQALRERCEFALNSLCAQAEVIGIKCKALLEDGLPRLCILDAIANDHIDLALIGTNAPHGFERLVFGSTAEAIIRKARCPVLTIGPHVAAARKADTVEGSIVFATDFDPTTMHAVRYAAAFANLIHAPLHCVHVLPRTVEAGAQSQIVPIIMTEALHQLVAGSGVVIAPPTCATNFSSEVSWAIVEYARQQKARVIILGVRQASLLASHGPEHIAYRVITESDCPVLTMAYPSDRENVDIRSLLPA